jgi:YegS/Rv2252/BmrU family lipid kinase
VNEAAATTPEQIGVILNPRAARGKAIQLLPEIVDLLRELGVSHQIHVTAAPGEAIEVARRFAEAGFGRVVAVGGDGVVNEVANGLLTAARPAMLGVVPASRGSDFARSLGSPRQTRAALTRAVTGAPHSIDVGLVRFADGRERHYVNIAGVGFDAVVAERANRSRVPGSALPYLTAIGTTLARHRNAAVSIERDGRRSEQRACAVLVANGRCFGGGMKIVPQAAIADGHLDLAVIGDLSKPDLIRTLPKVFWGGHLGHPKFHTEPVAEVRVESPVPLLVELDGEVVGRTPATFAIRPAALPVAG